MSPDPNLMKKLLSFICCIVYFNSFSQTALDTGKNPQKALGEKVLIKAIAVIVNPEGNKKAPVKQIYLSSKECPWL